MKIRKLFSVLLLLGAFAVSTEVSAQAMPGVEKNEVKERKSKDGVPFLPIVALLLGLSGTAVGVFSFLKSTKNEEKLRKLEGLHAKSLQNLNTEIQNLNGTVSHLRSQLSDVKNDLQRVSTHPTPAAPVSSPVPQAVSSQPAQPRPTYSAPAAQPVKTFFGTPVQGVFARPSTEYVAGNTLYCVEARSGATTGQFTYVDSPETAVIASRSLSRFVEVACVINGEVRAGFKRVVTITPGTVSKTSSGWKIDNKAVVKFV